MKTNKILSLTLAAVSVVGAGFASAFSSYAAYTEEEANNLVKQYIEMTVEQVRKETGKDLSNIGEFVTEKGTLNQKAINDLSQDFRNTVKALLDSKGLKVVKNNEGTIISVAKMDGTAVVGVDELKAILKKAVEKTDSIVISGNEGSVFVSGGSDSSGSSTSTTASDNVVKATDLPIVKSFDLEKVDEKTLVSAEKIVESLQSSKTSAAVTLNVGKAEWTIELTSINKSEINGFNFNPGISVTTLDSYKSVVPEDVKKIAAGKGTAVVNFAEKDAKKLPFTAKVKVSIDSKYANKSMKVYYVVDNKSYYAGDVTVDSKGQVICNFNIVGDFVFIEK